MENRTGAGSDDMMGDESLRRMRRLRLQRGRQGIGLLNRLVPYGELQLTPRRLSQRLHQPLFVAPYNVQFSYFNVIPL